MNAVNSVNVKDKYCIHGCLLANRQMAIRIFYGTLCMKNNIEETIGKYLPILMILPLAGLAELASLYSIQALLPKLSEVYNIPLNQVGMILSAEVGFLALAMLFSGTLSDRFGRKPIIFIRCWQEVFNSIVRNCIIMADAGGIPRFARHCSKWYYGGRYSLYQ